MNGTDSRSPDDEVPYDGEEALRAPLMAALHEVYDPEVAMSVVDVGLVYGVTAGGGRVDVRMTMTSPACPVAGQIIDDIQFQLGQILPEDWQVEVQLCWDPPWTPDRMSERGRRLMGW